MDSQAEILNKIGVTHSGTYCLTCGANFPPHLWRRHFNRHHPDINLPKKVNNITKILQHKITEVLSTEDPLIYRADTKIYKNIKCTSCNGIFRDNHQIQKHLKSHHNFCHEQSSTIIVQCYLLKCGRMFPITQPIEQQHLTRTIPNNQQIPHRHDYTIQQSPLYTSENTPHQILNQQNHHNKLTVIPGAEELHASRNMNIAPSYTNQFGDHHTANSTTAKRSEHNYQPTGNITQQCIHEKNNLHPENAICHPHHHHPDNEVTQIQVQQIELSEEYALTQCYFSPQQQVVITPDSQSRFNVNHHAHSLPPNPAINFMQYFGSMPYSTTVHHSQVQAIIGELIDRVETPEYWLKILHKFIATDQFFIDNMKSQLQLQQLKPEIVLKSDKALKNLMDMFIDLEGHIKSIADGIPANWKSSLVKFEVSREHNNEIEGATTWSFRYRQNSSPQLREFGYLLCYLKKFHCPLLEKYYQYANSGNYCRNTAFKSGMVAKLIYELTVETVPNGDSIPWMCKFSLHRCFMMDGNKPKLKSPNVCGKQFATTLYLMREAVLTCASMMLQGGHSEQALFMIQHVQKCHVINMISPWISHCRAMSARSCQKESSHLASNGDIICNNATFRKCIYKQLIPLVRSSICETFNIIFENDNWRAFLSNQNMIRVSIMIQQLLF